MLRGVTHRPDTRTSVLHGMAGQGLVVFRQAARYISPSLHAGAWGIPHTYPRAGAYGDRAAGDIAAKLRDLRHLL